MFTERTKNPLSLCLLLYFTCFAVRMWEFLALRTDQSALSENIVHKIFGIVIIFVCLKYLHARWRDIGFTRKNWLKNIGLGLALGLCFYTVTLLIEFGFLYFSGAKPNILMKAGGFSLASTEQFVGVGIGSIIIFNIFNVWMEEGLFRGLFEKLLRQKYKFAATIFISALLFGLWHVAMPIRSFLDGEFSLVQTAIFSVGYVLFAFMFGLKMSWLYKMTGSLWLSAADHFFNNAIINIVHVVSNQGNDSLQIARIFLAQTLSFVFVWILWRRFNKKPISG